MLPKKTAIVILAQGTEEIEFTVIVDVLRRACFEVTTAGLDGMGPVCGANNILLMPDIDFDLVFKDTFDIVILPGGYEAAEGMATSRELGCLLKAQDKAYKYIAAICAAPLALLSNEIGFGRCITSYPAIKDKLIKDYKYVDCSKIKVVHSGNLITSRGPANVFDFALKIVSVLIDCKTALEIGNELLVKALL